MGKAKHTNGPWEMIIHEGVGGQDYIQVLTGSWDIAHNRHSSRDWEEEKANGRLIAAAPKLLEACKEAIRLYASIFHAEIDGIGHYELLANYPDCEKWVNNLRAAIAQAEGES